MHDDAAKVLCNAKADRKLALAELATIIANIPDIVSKFDQARNTQFDSKGTVDSLFDDFFSPFEDGDAAPMWLPRFKLVEYFSRLFVTYTPL